MISQMAKALASSSLLTARRSARADRRGRLGVCLSLAPGRQGSPPRAITAGGAIRHYIFDSR
jgi:hypothetical protein